MTTTTEYEAACKRAATDQGLDPFTEACSAAGVPVVLDQTGGMCMCAGVYDPDDHDHYVWATWDEDGWLVCEYGSNADGDDLGEEGLVLVQHGTLDQAVEQASTFYERVTL